MNIEAFDIQNDHPTVKVLGDGFVSITNDFSQELKEIEILQSKNIFFSNGDYDFIVTNKHNIKSIAPTTVQAGGTARLDNFSCYISDLSYAENLTSYLSLIYSNILGDLAEFKNTPLTYLNLSYCDVSGDIKHLAKFTDLTYLTCSYTGLYGNLDSLKNMTNLEILMLSNITGLEGDLESLKHLTPLKRCSFVNSKISGNLQSVKDLTNLEYLYVFDIQKPPTGALKDVAKLTQLTYLGAITQITGAIDEYVHDTLQYRQGQSGMLELNGTPTRLTLNGHALSGHGSIYHLVKWENANKFTFNSCPTSFGGVTGDYYSQCTTIFCKGYNETEIQQWVNDGKTVIPCD